MWWEKGGWKVGPLLLCTTMGMGVLYELWSQCLVEWQMPWACKLSNLTLLPKDEEGAARDLVHMWPIVVASVLYQGLMWIAMWQLVLLANLHIPGLQRGF